MKTISLTQNKIAIVCDCHYDLVKDFKWRYSPLGYAVRTDIKSSVKVLTYMHRLVKDSPSEMQVDHADMNRLNNVCTNLRVCTRSENMANQKAHRNNTSGYKGVTLNRVSNKWIAKINIKKKRIHLGTFSRAEDAAMAYDLYAAKYFGEFASLNMKGLN